MSYANTYTGQIANVFSTIIHAPIALASPISSLVTNYGSKLTPDNIQENNSTQNSREPESNDSRLDEIRESEVYLQTIENLRKQNEDLKKQNEDLKAAKSKKFEDSFTQFKKDKDDDDYDSLNPKINIATTPANIRAQAAQIAVGIDEVLRSLPKRDETESFQKQITNLTNEKKTLEDKVKGLEEALEKAKLEKDQQQKQITAYKQELEENKTRTENRLQESQNEREALQAQLREKEGQLESNLQKARQLNEKIEELNTEKKALSDVQEHLSKKSEEDDENINQQVSRITELERKVEEHEQLTTISATNAYNAEQRLEEVTKQKVELESQLATQKSLVADKEKKIDDIELEKDMLEGNKEALQKMLDEKTQKLDEKTLVHENLRAEYTTALSDNGKIGQEWVKIDKEYEKIQEHQTILYNKRHLLSKLKDDRRAITLICAGVVALGIGTIFCPSLLPVTLMTIKVSALFLAAGAALILAGLTVSAKSAYTFFNREKPLAVQAAASVPTSP